ncbi:hypothetical protein MNBD_GAMMA25-1322 [hydrothermal vent metagenome]|uniref:HMA domain-containing protein n=1 Tax=hydrothermal vent metagenome TaxID=652676 RepID=A0A3B1AUZ4_9ZZZZ
MSEQMEFDVKNVKCGGCASAIEDGLKPLDGVTEVDVNIENGHVRINGKALPEEAILDKLTSLGYPAK